MSNPDWNCVTVRCGYDQSELITETLEKFGAVSVSITVADSDEQTSVTALYDLDGLNLNALVEELETFRQGNEQFQVEQEILHGRDWVRESQNRFKPLLVNDRLWIISPWHEIESTTADVVTINPGLSFGTGHHPTTRMCLEFLTRHNLSDCEVIDFGCGSGILALSALKLGCRFAWGVDIDSDALDESADNAERNDLGFRYMAIHPDNLPGDIRVNLVLANLQLDMLVELSETLKSLVAENGWLVMSGILNSQVDQIREVYGDSFELNIEQEENWVMVVGENKT